MKIMKTLILQITLATMTMLVMSACSSHEDGEFRRFKKAWAATTTPDVRGQLLFGQPFEDSQETLRHIRNMSKAEVLDFLGQPEMEIGSEFLYDIGHRGNSNGPLSALWVRFGTNGIVNDIGWHDGKLPNQKVDSISKDANTRL